MKVGDMVRQCGKIMKMSKDGKPVKSSTMVGIVVAIHEHELPDHDDSKRLKEKTLNIINLVGRPVDVLWANGKLSKNFAENSLEVVKD
jgi:hypothetical protein